MKENKVIDWIKDHKGLIFESLIGACIFCYKNYYYEQMTKEGSKIWFRHASLDDLKRYRDEVQDKCLSTGVTSDADRMMRYIDKRIDFLKSDFGDLNIPPREHGWYLPEKN